MRERESKRETETKKNREKEPLLFCARKKVRPLSAAALRQRERSFEAPTAAERERKREEWSSILLTKKAIPFFSNLFFFVSGFLLNSMLPKVLQKIVFSKRKERKRKEEASSPSLFGMKRKE